MGSGVIWTVVAFVVAIAIVLLILKLIGKSMKMIWTILINAIVGFIALFVLIGNLQSIPFLNSLFKQWIIGNEVIFGVLSSQIISNVPAAILLSGFSTNYEAIIVGINIGGLGTLIASMANLISFKILAREFNDFKVRYFIVFTVLNIVLLFILLAVYFLTN
jgi:Na+/H+ antiporter NhaD/arsenite permease-like protein